MEALELSFETEYASELYNLQKLQVNTHIESISTLSWWAKVYCYRDKWPIMKD